MINKRIVVAIVTYNSRAYIGSCLAALSDLSQKDQVVIVDNHSTDGTVAYIQKQFPTITVIKNKRNYFLSYALNQIVRLFHADAYLVLNPDVVVTPEAIEKLCNILMNSKQIGIVAPALVSRDGSLQSNARRFPTMRSLFSRFLRLHIGGSMTVAEQEYLLENHTLGKTKAVDWVIGACMLVKSEVFDRVGLYRSFRYPLYYNDADLCWRAARGGFLVQYTPHIKALHTYQQQSIYGGLFTRAKLLHMIAALFFLCRRVL